MCLSDLHVRWLLPSVSQIVGRWMNAFHLGIQNLGAPRSTCWVAAKRPTVIPATDLPMESASVRMSVRISHR